MSTRVARTNTVRFMLVSIIGVLLMFSGRANGCNASHDINTGLCLMDNQLTPVKYKAVWVSLSQAYV